MKSLIVLFLACFSLLNAQNLNPCFGVREGIFFPHPRSPSKFLACFNGLLKEGSCPPGMEFDRIELECDYPENTGPSIPTRPTTGPPLPTRPTTEPSPPTRPPTRPSPTTRPTTSNTAPTRPTTSNTGPTRSTTLNTAPTTRASPTRATTSNF